LNIDDVIGCRSFFLRRCRTLLPEPGDLERHDARIPRTLWNPHPISGLIDDIVMNFFPLFFQEFCHFSELFCDFQMCFLPFQGLFCHFQVSDLVKDFA
jgi:hypothetical protein